MHTTLLLLLAGASGLAEPGEKTQPVSSTGPSYAAVFATGCTARLRAYDDGSYSFQGCPTTSCAGTPPCDAEESETILWCECRDDPDNDNYLCLSIVTQDANTGEILGWTCIQQQCGEDCEKVPAPAPLPPSAPIDFWACNC